MWVAIIVPAADYCVDSSELKGFLGELHKDGIISRYSIPDRFIEVECIDKTSVGKKQKKSATSIRYCRALISPSPDYIGYIQTRQNHLGTRGKSKLVYIARVILEGRERWEEEEAYISELCSSHSVCYLCTTHPPKCSKNAHP